jgi:hypothetical protein
MTKKTSRAARTQQNLKRQVAARPLVDTSGLVDEKEELETSETEVGIAEFEPLVEDKVETITERVSPLRQVQREEVPVPVIPRTSSKPLPRRFTNPAPKRDEVFTRQQEYFFIRSDLLTVTVLTTLMVILLVVLAILLSR